MGLPTEFLHCDVNNWPQNEDNITARKFFKSFRVVNDTAERAGVALIHEYNKMLTKNEEQKQCLLQIVKDYRRRHPN